MFEQNFENEDRYTQQGRRSLSPYSDRRSSSRPYDDRSENQDRHRYRGESDRRYTRPDYDSDLDIERPGQAHFGSSGGSDYGRDNDQDYSWQRPRRGPRAQDRYGYEGQNRSNFGPGSADYGSYGRGISDWGRGQADTHYGRGLSESGRDWPSTGAGMGHADWNRFGSGDRDQNNGRSFGQQQDFNEQKNRWPKSYKRSDERLKDDIHEELIRHGRLDASDIEVQVKEGEVTLTGQVASRHDKRIAEELAERVLGVHDVQNQLRVRQPNQGQSSDSQRNAGSTAASQASSRMSVASQQPDQSRTSAGSPSK